MTRNAGSPRRDCAKAARDSALKVKSSVNARIARTVTLKMGRCLNEQDAPGFLQVSQRAVVVQGGIERRGAVHEMPFQLEKPILVDVEAQRGCRVVLHVRSAAAVFHVGVVAGVVEPRVEPWFHAVGEHSVEPLAHHGRNVGKENGLGAGGLDVPTAVFRGEEESAGGIFGRTYPENRRDLHADLTREIGRQCPRRLQWPKNGRVEEKIRIQPQGLQASSHAQPFERRFPEDPAANHIRRVELPYLVGTVRWRRRSKEEGSPVGPILERSGRGKADPSINLAAGLGQEEVAIGGWINGLRKKDRHAGGIDVIDFVVKAERKFHPSRANAQPIGPTVVEVKPVEIRVETVERPEPPGKELDSYPEPIGQLFAEVEADFGELEAAPRRLGQVIVGVRFDESLADKAMHLDRFPRHVELEGARRKLKGERRQAGQEEATGAASSKDAALMQVGGDGAFPTVRRGNYQEPACASVP